MLRFIFSLMCVCASFPAGADPDVCGAAAKEIEASLRAFKPRDPEMRISIANAVQERPAAGLDFGSKLHGKEFLTSFPMTPEDRAAFDDAIRYRYRAGSPKGFIMLDSVRGTAHCHSPLLFTTTSGSPKPLKLPEPSDPFELCLYGGVALGAANGAPFYAQTEDDFAETDAVTIFPLREGELFQACTLSANYEIVYEMAELFCKEPGICSRYEAKAAKWAADFNGGKGRMSDPSLTQAAEQQVLDAAPELPMFGTAQSKLLPQPFRFGGPEAWFAVKDDPSADLLHIGIAGGPETMANWKAYTLFVFYKGAEPVASFAVEKKRGAFRFLAVKSAEK
jgi:hypothetical protein